MSGKPSIRSFSFFYPHPLIDNPLIIRYWRTTTTTATAWTTTSQWSFIWGRVLTCLYSSSEGGVFNLFMIYRSMWFARSLLAMLVSPIFLTKSTASLSRKVSNSLAWLLVSVSFSTSDIIWRWMIIGESGLGKSTLVNTLFNSQLYPPKQNVEPSHETPQTVEIQSITSDIEENGVRLQLTVVDTPGFGDFVNNEQRYNNDIYKLFIISLMSSTSD